MKYLFSVNDKKTEFKADYGQLLNYFKNNSHDKIISDFGLSHNKNILRSRCLNDSPRFKGGVFADIFADVVIDTKKHLDVKPIQGFVNKRKRFLSEHDGDYVHDRRYDINFMESARREKVAGNNLIRINACASFNCNISSEKINNYAREICELVNYFEAQGRSVELNLSYKNERAYRNAPMITALITVKRPDHYISKADIYRAISSLFFRHIGFSVFVLMADVSGKDVDSNLGRTPEDKVKIEVTPDQININGYTTELLEKIKNEQK